MNWIDDIPVCPSTGIATVTNERIDPDGIFSSHEHECEDCSFRLYYENRDYLYGVFDGHDGKRAAVFASQRFPAEILLEQRINDGISTGDVVDALVDAFNSVERGFFESISDLLTERIDLLQSLPKTMKDYQVFKKFPEKVERLQQLQELISGGAAAVIALIHEENLYIANVGDARALLCYRTEGNDIEVRQLSTDHTVGNKSEASRLQSLGIDVSRLTSYGVLGSHDNTRTLGDHYLKGGYKENDILSVSQSEPITAKPEVQSYHIDYNSWYFLILMSSGLYKTLETYSTATDPNTHIARLIQSELDKGKEINIVCKIVVDEICRTHRAFCGNNHRNNGCYHEDMTLLVRSFRHSDIRKQLQPLTAQSHHYTRVSPISDIEMFRNRQFCQSLQHDWSLSSITVPATDKTSTGIGSLEANSFDKQLFQKSSHSVTSHTIPELRERVNNKESLQHSVSIPNSSLASTSLNFKQPRNLNKIDLFNTLQVSKAQSYVNEQVTSNTSGEIFQSSQINFGSDFNGEFGQLVGSELPFSVKTESGQFFSSDDSNAAKLQNGLTKSTEFNTPSNQISDSRMITSVKYRINKYPDIDTQEKNFNNLNNGESTSNDEHDTYKDSTTNLAQVDQSNKHDDLSENGSTGIASLSVSYADSYVNFSPLEETLRKYGVEIDELVDGS